MADEPVASTAAQRRKHLVETLIPAFALGLAPWAAAGIGSYGLHSALVSFILYHALCVAGSAGFVRHHGAREHRPLHRRRWIGLAIVCLAVCAAAYLLVGFAGALIEPSRVRAGLIGQGIRGGILEYFALFVYFAVVNPAAEEPFWRGSVYLRFRQAGWSVSRAALVSALLFGSWHWLIVRLFFAPGIALVATAGIVAVGYAFAVLYERSRSLPALVLVHALGADVPILIALWAAVLRH